jgi:hypothetical protein
MNRHANALLHACLCATSAACTPTLDWRDVRPQGAGMQALFPCKPAAHARQVALAAVTVEMTLYACSAGGATYAVGFADIGDLQRVEPALAQLWASAARNIEAKGAHAIAPLRIEGMTPHAQTGRQAFTGRLSDGQQVQEQAAVFAHGTRVYQVTMVGPKLDVDAVETFFGALRLIT